MTYRVGYAKARITPTLERLVYLAGFAQNRGAVDVHDDLFVRALRVSLEADPGATVPLVILVALDLIGLARAHALEIERRVRKKIPNAQVLVACTHTHHGPDTIGLWGPDMSTTGVDPAYLAWLKEQVVETALRAAGRLKPAELLAASVHVPGVAKNARDPDIEDDELTCLQFVPSSNESAESTLTLASGKRTVWL